MKKTLLFLTLVIACMTGCKKDDDNGSNQIFIPNYHINGITDLTIIKNSSGPIGIITYMQLLVEYNNSAQERVSLSLENVPPGIGDTILNPTGFPSFNAMIRLIDEGVQEGIYPIKLVAVGEYSGRKEFNFNLNVTGPPDCTTDVIGNGYNTYNSCFGTNYPQNIVYDGVKNRVKFTNIDGSGTQVYGEVDCVNQRITLPSQTVNGTTYSGSGLYYNSGSNGRYVSMNLQMSGSGGSNSCTVSMSL